MELLDDITDDAKATATIIAGQMVANAILEHKTAFLAGYGSTIQPLERIAVELSSAAGALGDVAQSVCEVVHNDGSISIDHTRVTG